LDAAVTVVLNLDTGVVFMTPVLLHAARHRLLGENPFLYGAVFMANAASLLLPGSNLTNLIVLAHEHISGATFAAPLAPAWAVSVPVTIVYVALLFRDELVERGGTPPQRPQFRRRTLPAVAIAALLVLLLARPALPVLALGIVAALACGLGARGMVH